MLEVLTAHAGDFGKLGHGLTLAEHTPKRLTFFPPYAVRSVSCGDKYTCFVTNDGEVYFTGSGDCFPEETTTPKRMDFEAPIEQVYASSECIFAVARGRRAAFTCGSNNCGACGIDNGCKAIRKPELVDYQEIGAWKIVDVALGWLHGVVLLSNGTVHTFGTK